jgi:hypothetical protein
MTDRSQRAPLPPNASFLGNVVKGGDPIQQVASAFAPLADVLSPFAVFGKSLAAH